MSRLEPLSARQQTFWILSTLAILGCSGIETGPSTNPPPIVQGISPTMVIRSPEGASVDVLGLGFVDGAQVLWNDQPRPTTYVGGGQLTVNLSGVDLQGSAGQISVSNPSPGGGASSSVTLVVGNPTPMVESLSPTSAQAVITSSLELRLQGSDFVSVGGGATVLWDGAPLATTIVDSSELTAIVPDYLLRAGRNATVSVRNPGPGGGESNSVTFQVQNPVPTLTSTDPIGVNAGEDTELGLSGTGFVHGASVWFAGMELTPMWGSATELVVEVPGILVVGGETPAVWVENPAPGGGTSNSLQLVVYVSPPSIAALYPSRVFAGASDFTLAITGSGFDPAATVSWNGDPRPFTFVSSERLELPVAAADVGSPGVVEIRVVNPALGGEASTDFEIVDAPPTESKLLSGRTGGRAIVISEPDGTEILSVSVPAAYHVDASPIGTTAVYFNTQRIYEMDPYTGIARRVTTAADEAQFGQEQWPRYSADGTWIYYKGQTSAGRWELWRSPAAGGPGERLLASTSQSYGYPNPSHSGDRLVYSRGVSQGDTYLHILDLASGTSTPLGTYGATSRWTPDDQWIVYWNWDELRAIRPDGTGDFAIAPGTSVAPGFDISPDGMHIIAASNDWSRGFLISFPDGVVQELPALGAVRSMAWYGP